MDLFTISGIAVSLAMDAFAVALSAGVILDPITKRQLFRLGFHFGLFQAMMPVIGWLAGIGLRQFVEVFAPWIAFGLLTLVGGKMIYEAVSNHEEEQQRSDPTRGATMVMLSVATSIDALAVGCGDGLAVRARQRETDREPSARGGGTDDELAAG